MDVSLERRDKPQTLGPCCLCKTNDAVPPNALSEPDGFGTVILVVAHTSQVQRQATRRQKPFPLIVHPISISRSLLYHLV